MSFNRGRNASWYGELVVGATAPTGRWLHPAVVLTGTLSVAGWRQALVHFAARTINNPGDTTIIGDPFTVDEVVIADLPVDAVKDQGDAPPLVE